MIRIYTLGDFDIKIDGNKVFDSKGYPHRMIKLFKYFLTFKGKKLLPENIIEDLWPDNNFQDPKNVLRTQISRVRKMVNTGKNSFEQFYNIEYTNGYYVFETIKYVVIDYELFTVLVNEGNLLINTNPDKAIAVLKEGLSHYGGEYLPEIEYEDWIIPIRSKYHRLYLKGLLNYLEILKQKGMHQEIIETCEEAISHEPYGEVLHIYFIESLLEIGQKRYALSHYEYITSKLYNHLGIKPSSKMKALYKKLQTYDEDMKDNINLSMIDKELEADFEGQGALICEPYYFKFIYNLEKRKRIKNAEKNIFLGVLSIDNRGYTALSQEDIKDAMDKLIDVVYNNLRKGDILSKWNDTQLVSLLYGVNESGLNIVINRLKQKFGEKINNNNVVLNIKYKPL